MATLTVWKFATDSGAEEALLRLEHLEKEGLLTLDDGAVVSWPSDKKKPKTKQMRSLTGAGALGGSFWGLLFGLIFFVPLLGLAIGAAAGALSGSLADIGIDDDFIKQVQSQVTPGTSALFVLTENVVIDKVKEEFAGSDAPELIQTNLSDEQEAKLREAFAE